MTMEEEKCFIWGINVKRWSPSLEGSHAGFADSPRAGGRYTVEGPLKYYHLRELKPDEKVKLTDWLIEQREAGVETPHIDNGVLEHIKTRRKKAMPERIESLMSFLAKNFEIHDAIKVSDPDIMQELLAHSSSSTHEQLPIYLEYCESKRYLKITATYPDDEYAITVEGKIFAEEISRIDKQKRQCFVAMWFDENKKGMDDVYKKAIKPAIEDAGYKPYRVDKAPDLGNIVDQIIAQIRQSRFIIADFTAEKPKEPRGGVYYEAGFAYGLGLKVIPTCRKDFMEHIHFDTQQLRHIVWDEKDLQGFYEEIYDSIGANIDWSEDVKDKGTSFVGYKPK